MACLRIRVSKVGFRKERSLFWDLLGCAGLRWKRVGRALRRRGGHGGSEVSMAMLSPCPVLFLPLPPLQLN